MLWRLTTVNTLAKIYFINKTTTKIISRLAKFIPKCLINVYLNPINREIQTTQKRPTRASTDHKFTQIDSGKWRLMESHNLTRAKKLLIALRARCPKHCSYLKPHILFNFANFVVHYIFNNIVIFLNK